jgi:hypothetical protein
VLACYLQSSLSVGASVLGYYLESEPGERGMVFIPGYS